MSENWITLGDVDVLGEGHPERVTIARFKRVDDLPAICGQVTQEIRQAYGLSNRDLGPDNTIPEGLKQRAIALALWRFVTLGVPRLPRIQTRERADAAKEAQEYIAQITRREVGTVTRPSVGTRTRNFDQGSQDGI